MMLRINIHRWFAMVVILNQKWSPKYKNRLIWAKFGFQVYYGVANWYRSLVSYGGHFESKMAAKIQKSSNLDEIWFPSRLWCSELISIVGLLWRPFRIQNGSQNTKSSDLDEIWFPSRLWCCELKSIVCFAMVAILNPKWPPKYKNRLIWAKFGFQVDYGVAN